MTLTFAVILLATTTAPVVVGPTPNLPSLDPAVAASPGQLSVAFETTGADDQTEQPTEATPPIEPIAEEDASTPVESTTENPVSDSSDLPATVEDTPSAASDPKGDHVESAPHSEPEAQTPPPHPAPVGSLSTKERDSLMRIGAAKLAEGDPASALIAYRQVAASHPAPKYIAPALIGLARAFSQTGESIKSVATYEHLLKNFEGGSHTPTVNLEVGRVLRDLGSSKLALARFYSVIHTTLKLSDGDHERYRKVVRTAQFEIAETHLLAGNYAEAARYFQRFELLDAAPGDRAWAQFKAARALELAGENAAATQALRDFIIRHPEDENAPEAHFILANLLERQGLHEDSLRVTLNLLQNEQAQSQSDQFRWRQWQQRTGNQLAHAFYERGEFNSALVLYRSLALLNDEPQWRLPLLYQQALCHERLMDYLQAREAYTLIIESDPAQPASELSRMAQWRAEQIDWWQQTQQSLQSLRPPSPSNSNT